MSAFIVEDETYLKVYTALLDDKFGFSKEDVQGFIKDFRIENYKGVNYRYNEDTIAEDLIFKQTENIISDVQLYKHLNCIEYQCTEHISIMPPKIRLFKKHIESVIDGDSITSKEYSEASWG